MKTIRNAMAVALLLAAAAPTYAHHSFTKVFDSAKPVKVQGVITKLEWANPHVWFQMDAKDAQGNVQKWRFEVQGVPTMARAGWKRNSFIGEEVIVDAAEARELVINGFYTGAGERITLVKDKRVVYRRGDD